LRRKGLYSLYMTYNSENIKYLVKVLRNKKDTNIRLVNTALSKYYGNINKTEVTDAELMDEKLFYTLCKKFIYDQSICRKKN
jgi:16S rRNA U1498 N3-methylase RsmE